jgi:hypothetical protein
VSRKRRCVYILLRLDRGDLADVDIVHVVHGGIYGR